MRCWRCSKSVADVAGAAELLGDVRTIQRRRSLDEAGLRLSLAMAERGTAWLARDAGEPIGIAIAADSDDERYIGDLYVEPSFRGQGIGDALLAAAFRDVDDFARAMLVDGGDLAATVLALQFGMVPRAPLLRVAGAIPREEELAKMAAGDYRFEVAPIDALAHGVGLNELDRHARGVTRPQEHTLFAQTAAGHAFFLRGEMVGYAYVWRDGRVGPLACASEAYLVQIFAYALVTLARQYAASWCTLLVPGTNRRIARAALRSGLRIEAIDVFSSDSIVADLSTYVAYHRLLV
jgi:GNAT superfamily N-acetyltransferase